MSAINRITQNRLKYFSRFSQKKNRLIDRKFLIEGIHLVEEVLKSDWILEALVINNDILASKDFEKWQSSVNLENVAIFNASSKDYAKLADTVTSQGVIGLVAVKQHKISDLWPKLKERAVIIALDNVSDPGNLGTILRACDWFGVEAVFLNKDSVELFNPKVVRATMGSLFHLPVISDVDFPEILKNSKRFGFKIIATTISKGISLPDYNFQERSVIVFGNEAHGISAEVSQIADEFITIPKYGRAESLNVSVACGVVLARIKIGS